MNGLGKPARLGALARGIALAGLLALVSAGSGCDPTAEGRPGVWLSGEVAEAPPGDWAFSDEVDLIQLESETVYGIPHSVTVVCFRYGGDLYVPSRGAVEKFWVSNVLRYPDVRLRIAGRIYPARAEQVDVEDPAVRAPLMAAIGAKYPDIGRDTQKNQDMWIFRMTAGS
jgi:hypothetical protein